MQSMSLSGSQWRLSCHWPHQWRMRAENPLIARPMLLDIPAAVPGGIHADLLRAGVIPDWQNNLDAFASEWVSSRQWNLQRDVNVPDSFDGRVSLECDGLDYAGHVLIDDEHVASFEGTHLRHRFDLGGHVQAGQTFRLTFIFEPAPEVDGQIGWTSRTRVFKPRFGYEWDWCSRVINLGIWQDLRLVSRGAARLARCRVLPRLGDDLQSGSVRVVGAAEGKASALRCVLADDAGREVSRAEIPVEAGMFDHVLATGAVKPWWPATHGPQNLYGFRIELLDDAGRVSDVLERTVGFKRVRWLANPGGPEGARPWLCEINGREVFLRGANWVPLSPLYGCVTPEDYERTLRLYRGMHANLLRVWGGAILETETFYAACDRLGLLVWQEFPLSSSGIENWPPEDPQVIAHLQRIGAEYIERRAHYASHLLWCGGNELQGALDGSKTGGGKPIDESHPLMVEWARLVERMDPGKRFIATSPMGPRFSAEASNYGKGLHHHVHGPWANLPLSERYAYWNGDDSTFRSETGAPGAASMALLERHRGRAALWPPRATNPAWLIPAAWWIPWDDVAREFGPIADDPAMLEAIVKASRYLQAESYRYSAESVRRHFPRCGGFVIWMGHDCMHCTSNNSVIEIGGSTKPAYDWLQRAWAPVQVSLEHDSIAYAPGAEFAARVWLHRDDAALSTEGTLAARLRDLEGGILEEVQFPVRAEGHSACVADLKWTVPQCRLGLVLVDLAWDAGAEPVVNRYLLSQQHEHPLAPLLAVPPATLDVRARPGEVLVSNTSDVAAIAVRLAGARPGAPLLTPTGSVIVLPGENLTLPFEHLEQEHGPLQVEWFNAEAAIGCSAAI